MSGGALGATHRPVARTAKKPSPRYVITAASEISPAVLKEIEAKVLGKVPAGEGGAPGKEGRQGVPGPAGETGKEGKGVASTEGEQGPEGKEGKEGKQARKARRAGATVCLAGKRRR